MTRLVEDQSSRFVAQGLQACATGDRTWRQESLENETVCWLPRHRECGNERARPRHGRHPNAGLVRGPHERVSRITDPGRAGITDQGNRLTLLQAPDQLRDTLRLVVFVQRDEAGIDTLPLEQAAAVTRILGCHDSRVRQHRAGARRQITAMTDRCGNDMQRTGRRSGQGGSVTGQPGFGSVAPVLSPRTLLTPLRRVPILPRLQSIRLPGILIKTFEPMYQRLRPILFTALVALVVAACAPPEPPPGLTPAEVAELEERAERNLAEGRILAAVRIYRDLIDATEGEEAQHWRLAASEVLFDHGYPELALEHHQRLDAEPVPDELRLRKRVVDGQAAVARRQGVRALNFLPAADPDIPLAVRVRIHATRADALMLLNRPEDALAERVRREVLLAERSAIQHNQEEIWLVLEAMSDEQIETIRDEGETRIERGWADLALRMHEVRTGRETIDNALLAWRERYPGHPAVDHFEQALRERMVAEMTLPERIDVLLPLTGRHASPAGAIRDGLMAAWYNTPDYIRRPHMVFHDVGEDGVPVEQAYENAVRKGSGFIIGPLDRASVTTLAESGNLPVPVLTLNYLRDTDVNPPAGFYQFGLLPEDEARQAAEGAIENDRFNALVLVPDDDWGARLESAFRERFEELGGVVLESAGYDPRDTDYSLSIQQLLNIDESVARRRLVQSVIGERVQFEPRRREDVEVIFLAANPRQGRLAKPQLDFHRIGLTPIYATSHVYGGRLDPDADWDMNGLFFTETPWIVNLIEETPDRLQQKVAEQWPDAGRRFPRLFALGSDAYDVLPHIGQLDDSGRYRHVGRTGRLGIDEDSRIRRQLRWVRFERGVPVALETPALPAELEIPLGSDILDRADEP